MPAGDAIREIDELPGAGLHAEAASAPDRPELMSMDGPGEHMARGR